MKLTQKHFNEFKTECLRLQKEWGLTDWELYFNFIKLDGSIAICNKNLFSRNATLTLNNEMDDSDKRHLNVKNSAKHEMIHVLLSPLDTLAYSRFVTQDELN